MALRYLKRGFTVVMVTKKEKEVFSCEEEERQFFGLVSQLKRVVLTVIPCVCKLIEPANEKWKFYRKMDHSKYILPSEKLWFVNNMLEKNRCRSHMHECTEDAPFVESPSGLSLFDALPVCGRRSAVRAMRKLFIDERRRPTALATLRGARGRLSGKNRLDALFIGRDSHIYFPETLCFLFNEGYKPLAWFVLAHGMAFATLLGGSVSDLTTCLLSMVRYDPGVGLKVHFDGVHGLDQSFGPVFTVPMGVGSKCLDLFPTVQHHTARPMRLVSSQFQPTLMQGDVRLNYSHSVPHGQVGEHMTLIFRFRAFHNTVYPKQTIYSDLFQASADLIDVNGSI